MKKIKDLVFAGEEEFGKEFLESDTLKTTIIDLSKSFVSKESSEVIGSFISAISPRLNAVVLNYKQKRFERNVAEAIEVLNDKVDKLESNYILLTPEVRQKFNEDFLEWMIDDVITEKQVEKIKFYINGYINLMSNEANNNLMLMFFNSMNELTTLDIDVLNMYSYSSDENITNLCDKHNLEYDQINAIKYKLERLGLLSNNNDVKRDSNLDSIVDYLNDVNKEMKKKIPKNVTVPRMKKTTRYESYSISRLGNTYLKIIEISNPNTK